MSHCETASRWQSTAKTQLTWSCGGCSSVGHFKLHVSESSVHNLQLIISTFFVMFKNMWNFYWYFFRSSVHSSIKKPITHVLWFYRGVEICLWGRWGRWGLMKIRNVTNDFCSRVVGKTRMTHHIPSIRGQPEFLRLQIEVASCRWRQMLREERDVKQPPGQ